MSTNSGITGQSTFMLPPYKGVDELLPVAAIKAPNCETLLNFNVTQGGIELRNGDSIYKKITPSDEMFVLGLFTYGGNGGLFLALQYKSGINDGKIEIWDVDSQAVVYTSAAAPNCTVLVSTFFDGCLFLFDPADTTIAPGIKYTGAAWSASGYTGAGNFYPGGGNIYNHRQYMTQVGEAAYWYSGIDSVAGACTKVPLAGIFSEKCVLAGIVSLTLAETVSSVTYQAFISSIGEVLFYTGDYPNADNWSLVGRATVAQPLDFQSWFPYQGDTLLLTDAGLVSLRDLFLKGSEDGASLTLSAVAEKSWVALVKAIRAHLNTPIGPIFSGVNNGKIKGIYDATNSRLIISFPYSISPTLGLILSNYYFIFDTQLGAWFFHMTGQGFEFVNFDAVCYKGKVLLASTDIGLTKYVVRIKEGATGFTDRDVDDASYEIYSFESKFAPVPFTKDRVHTILSIEPILESDLYSLTKYNLIADFGRQTTNDQYVDALTTSVQKPLVNVGIAGANFAQIKISGATSVLSTVGLTLYGCNVQYEAGERGSR